jgi:tetratricopeptide (TPR) repeat protein
MSQEPQIDPQHSIHLSVAAPSNAVSETGSSRQRHRLSYKKKALFSVFMTVFLLLAVELFLGLVGIQPQFFSDDPFVGFRAGTPLFIRQGDFFVTNPAKAWYFNDQRFPIQKTARTYRIFCLGGSTTYGHPYDDQTSFVGWLRVRLQDAEPNRDWQVINCGGISYASYRNSHLMQELAAYQPDLFVVYDGHNEFLEERTYAEFKRPGAVMFATEWIVARTRIGTVLSRLAGRGATARHPTVFSDEVDSILKSAVGPEQYHRDPNWQSSVVEHFRTSLDRDVQIARNAGAQLILVKPACNLRSFSPFKSESGPLSAAQTSQCQQLIEDARSLRSRKEYAAAARQFIAAAELDRQHALTQWEAADALWQAGDLDASRSFFVRAIDEDICPLRATTRIVSVIEESARQNRIPLVDFEKLLDCELERTSGPRIPGDESFLDHVHPVIDNNRLIAWGLFDEMVKLRIVRDQPSDDALVDRVSQKVYRGIDRQRQALALVNVSQVLVSAGKDEEALKLTERAEELHGGLTLVAAYRGRILEKLGRADEALSWYQRAVDRDPRALMPLSRLAAADLARGDWNAARDRHQRSLELAAATAPASLQAELHTGLGKAYLGLELWSNAVQEFRRALSITPQSAEAVAGLNEALRRSRSDDLP